MTRHVIIFLILTFSLTFSLCGQADFSIQGSWECYTSLDDTTDAEGVQVWYFFDNTKVSTLLVPNYGLPPESASIISAEEYKLKNDTLQTFHEGRTNIALIFVLNSNLISILPLGAKEEEKFYLKRVIK